MNQSSQQSDLSLTHLQYELARIDVFIRREIKRWQLAGQDPTDAFRGLHITDDEATFLAHQPLNTTWGDAVNLPPDAEETFNRDLNDVAQRIEQVLQQARSQGYLTRLEHLARAFNLDQFELDTLLIALAPTIDLRYQRLFAYLQDDATRKRPSVDLALKLCFSTPLDRLQNQLRFATDATLLRYRFITCEKEPGQPDTPLLAQTITPDPAILDWLLGRYHPTHTLNEAIEFAWPPQDVMLHPTAFEHLPDLQRLVNGSPPPVFTFYGTDHVHRETTALALATTLQMPLLKLDVSTALKTNLSPLNILRLVLRDAHLNTALVYLDGLDQFWEEDGELPETLITELNDYPGPLITGSRDLWLPVGSRRERPVLPFEFAPPPHQKRGLLWRDFLTAGDLAKDESGIAALAGQFVLTTGQIRDAVASAYDRAVQRGDSLQLQDLYAAARAHSSQGLDKLARKIVPRYTWTDIVLPELQVTMLHELVDTVKQRPKVLEEWGVRQKLASSAGVTVLFAGPPGSGKTMAAEVIANELQLDLYKIDLSSMISKYIGETEKNLEKIFNAAQQSNAILFFDEADAIFGKRSEVKDARDRYANIEVSYLLQRMESYDGVTILATNLRANLDEAFTRRIHFIVDVPFPDEAYRQQIWEALFPPHLPHAADLDFVLLARQFKLAGGNIRNIIVSAAYLAAARGDAVTMDHLFHAARRELQKMGRLVSSRLPTERR